MSTVHSEPTQEEWRELARQASKEEEDPSTLFSIVERLIAKYREWKTRLGSRATEMN